MTTNTQRAPEQTDWDTELARNTEQFFEADRLETQAYAIIGSSLANAEAWLRFTEAKQLADAKRTEAYQDLMRIRRGMESSRRRR